MSEIEKTIAECVTLADEHGLKFDSPIKDKYKRPYDNRQYYGKNMDLDEDERQTESYDDIRGHWISSSDFC